jgi:hypothetical protein
MNRHNNRGWVIDVRLPVFLSLREFEKDIDGSRTMT